MHQVIAKVDSCIGFSGGKNRRRPVFPVEIRFGRGVVDGWRFGARGFGYVNRVGVGGAVVSVAEGEPGVEPCQMCFSLLYYIGLILDFVKR